MIKPKIAQFSKLKIFFLFQLNFNWGQLLEISINIWLLQNNLKIVIKVEKKLFYNFIEDL